MNTYSEEPDGFILYDERPDPFDNRRASRTRFAAVNLPILLGISAVSALLLWITQSCLGQCGINRQVGGAVHVFAIALYGLLHYQSTWLEKRCNDAGKGHYPAIWMFRISLVLAAISLILPVFTLPMVAGGLLQFVYGMILPSNPLPNLMGYPTDCPQREKNGWTGDGYPKANSTALQICALLACITAVLMAVGLLHWF